jgi:hypothetical protein
MLSVMDCLIVVLKILGSLGTPLLGKEEESEKGLIELWLIMSGGLCILELL